MTFRQRLRTILTQWLEACLSPLRWLGRQCDRLAVAIERRLRR
ncbi:hypothetical protein [Halomonas elongata]|nr:hypothetical protein [Halomonas elongata]